MYSLRMTGPHPHRAAGAHTLSIKIGKVFEAKATGWGVVGAVIALIVLLVASAAWTLATVA